MKKNVQFKRILVGTVVAASLLSMSVIAADQNQSTSDQNQTATEGYVSPTTQETDDKAKEEGIMPINEEVTDDKKETAQMKYQLVEGKISEVTEEEGYTQITVTNDDMGMVFTVAESVFVIDQKDGSYKTVADLKVGMDITALLDNNSPMTMSLPPITPGAAGFVINAEGVNMELAAFGDTLVNKENTLQLNIDDKTVIVDIRGTKKVFVSEDVKNSEALVFYGATTRSIPAQTAPNFVMIVNNEEMSPVAEAPKPEVAPKPEEEVKPVESVLVGLRDMAVQTGYTIQWTANDQPVILEKAGNKIQVTVGSDIYLNNGKEEKLTLKTELKDSKIFVSSELATILK